MVASVLTHPKIPAATHRAHLKQRNQFCDQVRVLDMAKAHPQGQRFADMNACAGKDVDVNLHWPDGPKKNHYTYIAHGKKRRKMTKAEQHRPVIEWTAAEIATWRKRRFAIGRVGKHTVGTVALRQQQAKHRGVTICWEIKSYAYATDHALAQRFAAAVVKSGWPAYVMTLVTMRGWGGKLRNFHEAGMQTALLAHGAHKPAAFATYAKVIDRVWGRWHK